jgi:hypothetical protein
MEYDYGAYLALVETTSLALLLLWFYLACNLVSI